VPETQSSDGRSPITGRFLPGNDGGPGRQVGSRHSLAEAFLKDFYATWQESGIGVLRRLIDEDPAAYAKIAALLVSKIDEKAKAEGGVTVVNVITGVHG
jgi:hypothetical protein